MIKNTGKQIEEIKTWLIDYFSGNNLKAVIGISGGKDSTIAAKLLVDAIGKDRVIGVMMPSGEQPDINDAKEVCDILDIENHTINIGNIVYSVISAIPGTFNNNVISKDTMINIPPRIRMTVLYAMAQSVPGGGRVVNTCNRSEDYIGFSTKYGDSAGDFAILSHLTVSEILDIGDKLGLPKHLVHKAPSDGFTGMTDEDNFGFTYDVLDKYILTGMCEDEDIKDKIDRMHNNNRHKFMPIACLQNNFLITERGLL